MNAKSFHYLKNQNNSPCSQIKQTVCWDFPGSLVVRTLLFHNRSLDPSLVQKTKIPQAVQQPPPPPAKKTPGISINAVRKQFIHCSNSQKTSRPRLLFNTVLEVLVHGVSRHSKKTKIKLPLFRVCMTVYAENPKEHTKKITKISEYNHQFYLYILAITHQKRS